MAKRDDAKALPELIDGMIDGDKRAMESFFRYVDVLEDKKLKKDGRHALVMVVSVVEMLLPQAARWAYAAAASDREGSRPARKKKYTSKKAGLKKKT